MKAEKIPNVAMVALMGRKRDVCVCVCVCGVGGEAKTETLPNQGTRALIIQQTCPASISAVSKPIFKHKKVHIHSATFDLCQHLNDLDTFAILDSNFCSFGIQFGNHETLFFKTSPLQTQNVQDVSECCIMLHCLRKLTARLCELFANVRNNMLLLS